MPSHEDVLPREHEREPRAAAAPHLLAMAFSNPAPRVLLVEVRGELDLASAPEFDARVRQLVHEQSPRHVLLDLAGLRFLGLQGIAVFERLRRRAAACGVRVGLAALSPTGARALEFAGVLPRFDRYADVAAALAALPAERAGRHERPEGLADPARRTGGR